MIFGLKYIYTPADTYIEYIRYRIAVVRIPESMEPEVFFALDWEKFHSRAINEIFCSGNYHRVVRITDSGFLPEVLIVTSFQKYIEFSESEHVTMHVREKSEKKPLWFPPTAYLLV